MNTNIKEMKDTIGFGCYLPGKSAVEAVNIMALAIEAGFRYFDTASFYETERSLGKAIAKTGIDRDDLFIASKLWIDERGYQEAKDALNRTLERLGVDYLDAYIIHWPRKSADDTDWKQKDSDTFRAMIEMKEQGLIRNIGTSNFLSHHLESLAKEGFVPELNQLELHPGYMQEYTLRDTQAAGILAQAWSPLGRGAVLDNELLKKMANKYGKSVPQICLIYLMERGIMPIVKASSRERMLANLDVFDTKMDKEDVQIISSMPQTGWSGEHPDFHIPALASNFDQ